MGLIEHNMLTGATLVCAHPILHHGIDMIGNPLMRYTESVLPDGFRWDFELKEGEQTAQLLNIAWPNYLIDRSDLEEPSTFPSTDLPKDELSRRFLLWGVRSSDALNKLCAFASALAIPVDLEAERLPTTGWRFACDAFWDPKKTNCLCLLSATVDPAYRSQGFSVLLIEQAKELARSQGFSALIAPVRPSRKEQFPEMSMEDYVARRMDDGQVSDPWLRTHLKLGAVLMNVCNESILVRASVKQWTKWTGIEFRNSGNYLLPQGLVPLAINLETDIGEYREPNIWVKYALS